MAEIVDLVTDGPAALPELEIREFRAEDAHNVKEFCLNNLMQRARLSNQYVYRSSVWLGMYLSALAWATQVTEPWKRGDWGRWAFLCCAVSALFLVGVDYFTYFYYEKSTKSLHNSDEFLQDPAKFIESKKGKCWVALYDNGLVGTVVVRRPSPSSPVAEITDWYVRARYREKGLGSDLLQEALKYTKTTKCSALIVTTHTINTRANKTLQSIGFEKISKVAESNIYWRILRMKNFKWNLDPRKYNIETKEGR